LPEVVHPPRLIRGNYQRVRLVTIAETRHGFDRVTSRLVCNPVSSTQRESHRLRE
jgi:hypothetical protein